jgi:hypothetical protein
MNDGGSGDTAPSSDATATPSDLRETIEGLGLVAGKVVDDTSGAPLADVAVKIDGVDGELVTAADGNFAIGGPRGRAVTHFRADGYVPMTIEIPNGTDDLPLEYRLVSRAAETTVPTTGATVSAGNAAIVFPSGAYASDQSVRATYLEGAKALSAGVRSRTVDSEGKTIQVFGVVDVETSAEPATNVTVRVPVGAGVTAAFLYDRDDKGKLVNPIAGTIADGKAEFSVGHFSQKVAAAAYPSLPNDYLVSQAKAANTTAGSALAGGIKVTTEAGGYVEIVDPRGTVFVVGESTVVTLDVPATAGQRLDGCDMELEPGAGGVLLEQGALRPSLSKERPPSQRAWFHFRSRQAIMGVRGTTLTTRTSACPDKSRTLVTTEVIEGSADICTPQGRTTLEGGQKLTTCAGCPSTPACCDQHNCQAGCCTADIRTATECTAGTSAETCGKGGTTCDSCGSGVCRDQMCTSLDAIIYKVPAGLEARILGSDSTHVYVELTGGGRIQFVRIPKQGGKPLPFGGPWSSATVAAPWMFATFDRYLIGATLSTQVGQFLGYTSLPVFDEKSTGYYPAQTDEPLAAYAGNVYQFRRITRGSEIDPPECGDHVCESIAAVKLAPGGDAAIACHWLTNMGTPDTVYGSWASAAGVHFVRYGIDQSFTNFSNKTFLSFCPIGGDTMVDVMPFDLQNPPAAVSGGSLFLATTDSIERFAGAAHSKILSVGGVSSLAVDATTLYWVRYDPDTRKFVIEKATTAGTGRSSVNSYADGALYAFAQLTVDDKFLYFSSTSRAVGTTEPVTIRRIPK